jgi:alkylation response protein AidB-like acyl-CoA dehydrogenase
MDFSLTTEQIDIQKAAEEFAKGEFDPDAALEYDEKQEFPSTLWKKACELGFVGIHFPEEYGGPGFGLLENALITEAFCRQDSGIGMALALSDFGSEMILRHGDENQKRKVLPAIAQGEGLVTMAALEEGYSLAPLSTTVTLNQDGYTIEGKKTFVTLGRLATFMIVICQSKSDDPYAQSVILLDAKADNVEAVSMGKRMGMRMVPMDQVSFHHVKAPKENRIGQEDKGSLQLKEILDEMRIEAGAMGVGIAQGGLDRALDYGKKREQFGKTIVNFDAIRNKLADMYMEVELARLVTYKAAWSFDRGRPDYRSSLMAKSVASRTAYTVTYDALQIYGGLGYMTESHIEHLFRDAKVLDLFLEPGKMQRSLLAEEIIGKRDTSA